VPARPLANPGPALAPSASTRSAVVRRVGGRVEEAGDAVVGVEAADVVGVGLRGDAVADDGAGAVGRDELVGDAELGHYAMPSTV
jgi:hypothetical protein